MRKRDGFTLIELLVVVVIIGILASVAMPSFVDAQDRARNASMASNVSAFRTALENYAADHNAAYPEDDAGDTALNSTVADKGFLADNYLPGNKFPISPWGKQPQAVIIKAGSTPPVLAPQSYEDPTKEVPQPGTLLGLKGVVVDPPTLKQHYGALVYDSREGTNLTYTLHGIGKKKDQALIAGIIVVAAPD